MRILFIKFGLNVYLMPDVMQTSNRTYLKYHKLKLDATQTLLHMTYILHDTIPHKLHTESSSFGGSMNCSVK
jgi:hypothetical protein